MKYLLIPVKDLSNAKQRLSGLLSGAERSEFAGRMLAHTLGEASRSRGCDRVAVVTLSEPAVKMAGRLGFEVIREREQVSESISVDYALRILSAKGASAALRLPIDLPLVTAEEIDTIFSEMDLLSRRRSVVMVASRDQTGTNAIGRTPPDLFPSHFGPGSLKKHREEARLSGSVCRELRLPGVECDIDDPADLSWFLEHGKGTHLHKFLTDLGLNDRIMGSAG
jgi:2-phospho-L-lactate/phosphoenolpyruvate guanylyltransferase